MVQGSQSSQESIAIIASLGTASVDTSTAGRKAAFFAQWESTGLADRELGGSHGSCQWWALKQDCDPGNGQHGLTESLQMGSQGFPPVSTALSLLLLPFLPLSHECM